MPARATGAPDIETKAGYLARFAPFVIWPPGVFASASTPLVVCVQGDDPFGGALDRAAAGQTVGVHPLVVRRVPRLGPGSDCQIAYLAGSKVQSPAAALRAVDGEPVLTVTDWDGPGGEVGIVHLVHVDGRVRFVIDAGRAGRSGLAISSKLLALAAQVRK
ncbi:MAG TPA: YfiR family protein [Caulobacteraceae bacterium]|nr:YfiR family protein [Caulobacteraceae bacterium]